MHAFAGTSQAGHDAPNSGTQKPSFAKAPRHQANELDLRPLPSSEALEVAKKRGCASSPSARVLALNLVHVRKMTTRGIAYPGHM